MKNNLRNGFSLIEMILVITIMGIIATAIMPLLDTKRVKMMAAEKFSNDIIMVQEASKNYYMNKVCDIENNTGHWGFLDPTLVTTIPVTINGITSPCISGVNGGLILDNYLSIHIENPFDATASATNNWGISESITIDPSNGKELQYNMSYQIPIQYSGIFIQMIPQTIDDSIANPPTDPAKFVTLKSSVVIPGIEPSLNNLMHRDAGAHQELRTSHGSILIHDNINTERSKLVITDDNDDVSTEILQNGNTDLSKTGTNGSITIGNLGVGRYGIKGVGDSVNNNLSIEASNTDKDGFQRSGYVKLGVEESKGVVQGGEGQKITLADKDGFYVFSSKTVNTNPFNNITFIGKGTTKSGQVWLYEGVDTVPSTSINQEGQVATSDSFKIKRNNSLNVDPWLLSTNKKANIESSFNELNRDNSAVSIKKNTYTGVYTTLPVQGVLGGLIKPAVTKTINANGQSGLIEIHGSSSGNAGDDNIATITKRDEFFGPIFLGSTLHIGTYSNGDVMGFPGPNGQSYLLSQLNQMDENTKVINSPVIPCANGKGKVIVKLLGVGEMYYDGKDYKNNVISTLVSPTPLSNPHVNDVNVVSKLFSSSYNGFQVRMLDSSELLCMINIDQGLWTSYLDRNKVKCRVTFAVICSPN